MTSSATTKAPKFNYNRLRVYWNVPTNQCRSKRIPFENLKQFGIIQNEKDDFRGDKIVIFYDPGLFPAIFQNQTSGQLRYRNGGVPQEGDLEEHLESFRAVVNQTIPDPDFRGNTLEFT
ncbi:hyaluronidase domain-containing protein [Phthorimaea operculella]|nr:hyaluronidase domain-containing protein [Phthorimaea operculella]